MFHSVKLKDRALTVISLVCAGLFVAVCLLALRAGAPDTVLVGGERVSLRIGSDSDIETFVRRCGAAPEELVSDREIIVPKQWNAFYTEYNELQRAQGFDLTAYKGKSARELTYVLGSGRLLTVLTSGGRIIAAHLADADGTDTEALIQE